MLINNIHFWYHPITGRGGVQYLMEHYFGIQFDIYDKEIVDINKKNIIVFLWEPKNPRTTQILNHQTISITIPVGEQYSL